MDRAEGALSNCLPVTRGVRTRLLAVLADAYPNLMVTTEIQTQLRARFGCNHRYRRENDDPANIPESLPQGCKFGSTCPALCWYGQAYPQLRKLAEFGLIEWYPAPTGGRPAAWRLATPDTDDAEPDQSEVAFGVDVIDLDTPTPPRED